jgi:hypothetical protein
LHRSQEEASEFRAVPIGGRLELASFREGSASHCESGLITNQDPHGFLPLNSGLSGDLAWRAIFD